MRTMRARFAAAPAEGWISLLLVARAGGRGRVVARRCRRSSSASGDWTDFLAVGQRSAGSPPGSSAPAPRWSRPRRAPRRGGVRRDRRAADHRLDPRSGGHPGRALPGDGELGRRAPSSTSPSRGLPVTRETGHYLLVLGLLVLGERPVRGVGGLPPRPPDRADHRPRHRPGREHVGHGPRPDLVPRPVLDGRAVPADPAPRPRRAGDLDPPPDRRPVDRRLALPPRRDRLHHGRDLRLARPDRDRPVGAAGRLLGRRPAGSRRDQPVAPADHPGRRPTPRPLGVPSFGRQVHDRRDLVDLERAGARDPPDARRRPAVLLARRRRTTSSRCSAGRRPSRPTSARPAGAPILDGTLDAIPTTAPPGPPRRSGSCPQSRLFKVVFSPIDPVVDQQRHDPRRRPATPGTSSRSDRGGARRTR